MDSSGRQRQFQIQLKKMALQLVFPEVKREALLAEFCRALAPESAVDSVRVTAGVPAAGFSELAVAAVTTLKPQQ